MCCVLCLICSVDYLTMSNRLPMPTVFSKVFLKVLSAPSLSPVCTWCSAFRCNALRTSVSPANDNHQYMGTTIISALPNPLNSSWTYHNFITPCLESFLTKILDLVCYSWFWTKKLAVITLHAHFYPWEGRMHLHLHRVFGVFLKLCLSGHTQHPRPINKFNKQKWKIRSSQLTQIFLRILNILFSCFQLLLVVRFHFGDHVFVNGQVEISTQLLVQGHVAILFDQLKQYTII